MQLFNHIEQEFGVNVDDFIHANIVSNLEDVPALTEPPTILENFKYFTYRNGGIICVIFQLELQTENSIYVETKLLELFLHGREFSEYAITDVDNILYNNFSKENVLKYFKD